MDYYGRFSDSISITYSSSTLSDTIVYVRLWWGQALGPVARDSIKNYVGNTATNVYCTGYVDMLCIN
jgi:hypothetical protein